MTHVMGADIINLINIYCARSLVEIIGVFYNSIFGRRKPDTVFISFYFFPFLKIARCIFWIYCSCLGMEKKQGPIWSSVNVFYIPSEKTICILSFSNFKVIDQQILTLFRVMISTVEKHQVHLQSMAKTSWNRCGFKQWSRSLPPEYVLSCFLAAQLHPVSVLFETYL